MLAVVLASALALPGKTAGQTPPPDSIATLTGQVVSATTGRPLEGAMVALLGSGLGAVTDSAGTFHIPGAPGGTDSVEVRYVGYEQNRVELDLAPGKTTRVIFLLSRTVLRLAEIRVEVRGGRRVGKLAGFERRRELGLGYFLTPDDLAERKPLRNASEAFRRVPGVYVGPYRNGRAPVLISRGRDCRPAIFIDGAHVPDLEIDDLAPEELGAVEIYRGPSEIPGQYLGFSTCGLIQVWTPDGSEAFEPSG